MTNDVEELTARIGSEMSYRIGKAVRQSAGFFICPTCRTFLPQDPGIRYCNTCGQRLIWKMEEGSSAGNN